MGPGCPHIEPQGQALKVQLTDLWTLSDFQIRDNGVKGTGTGEGFCREGPSRQEEVPFVER